MADVTPEASVDQSDDIEYVADPILETEEMKKLFVRGIHRDAEDEEVRALFDGLSDGVSECVVIRPEGKTYTFGFVTFETSELVDELLLKRSSVILNGKNLDINRAVPKNAHLCTEKTKKLFIANLPKTNCCEEDLRTYFEARHPKKYGTIESIQLIKEKDDQGNKTEVNKGFGFVVVSCEDMADKMAIQHAVFDLEGRKIELKKSVPTSEGRGRGRGRSRPSGARGGGGQYRGGGGGGYGGGYGAYPSYGYGGYGDYGSYGYGGYAGGGGYDQGYGGVARYRPY